VTFFFSRIIYQEIRWNQKQSLICKTRKTTTKQCASGTTPPFKYISYRKQRHSSPFMLNILHTVLSYTHMHYHKCSILAFISSIFILCAQRLQNRLTENEIFDTFTNHYENQNFMTNYINWCYTIKIRLRLYVSVWLNVCVCVCVCVCAQQLINVRAIEIGEQIYVEMNWEVYQRNWKISVAVIGLRIPYCHINNGWSENSSEQNWDSLNSKSYSRSESRFSAIYILLNVILFHHPQGEAKHKVDSWSREESKYEYGCPSSHCVQSEWLLRKQPHL